MSVSFNNNGKVVTYSQNGLVNQDYVNPTHVIGALDKIATKAATILSKPNTEVVAKSYTGIKQKQNLTDSVSSVTAQAMFQPAKSIWSAKPLNLSAESSTQSTPNMDSTALLVTQKVVDDLYAKTTKKSDDFMFKPSNKKVKPKKNSIQETIKRSEGKKEIVETPINDNKANSTSGNNNSPNIPPKKSLTDREWIYITANENSTDENTIPINEIRFSQDSISNYLSDKTPLWKLYNIIKDKGWKNDSPINVVLMDDGKYTSVDNRRLHVLKKVAESKAKDSTLTTDQKIVKATAKIINGNQGLNYKTKLQLFGKSSHPDTLDSVSTYQDFIQVRMSSASVKKIEKQPNGFLDNPKVRAIDDKLFSIDGKLEEENGKYVRVPAWWFNLHDK